jgi:twitching motility protein PilU
MTTLTEDQARAYMYKLLAAMSAAGGSDLFIAHDFPPSIKALGSMRPLSGQKLTGEITAQLANAMMNEHQRAEFAKDLECTFAIAVPGVSRFPRQRVHSNSMSAWSCERSPRKPNFEAQARSLKEVVMNKRAWCWWWAAPARASRPRWRR